MIHGRKMSGIALTIALGLAAMAQGVPSGFTVPVYASTNLGLWGFPAGFGWRSGSLALADFNGDGQMDAVVPGAYVSGVCFVFGPGPQTWLTTGAWPIAVATGDFDSDGDADLAVAEQDGGGISIFTNDGTGAMTRTFYATGDPAGPVGPTAVLAADMDKDGRLDLVVANRFAETVVVLHNTGAGFLMAQTVSVTAEPNALAAADLNNDGWLDIAVACASDDTVKILKSFGGLLVRAGTFPGGPYPVAVAAADLNADGNLDLAVANREAPQVTVLLSNGTGGYASEDVLLLAPDYGAFEPPTDVQLVDTNADGKIDINCAGKTLRNDGTANFTVIGSATWGNVAYARGFLPGEPYPLLGAAYRLFYDNRYLTSDTVNVTYQAPPPANPVAGDVDGDGLVDVLDLLYLVGGFGKSVGDTGYLPICDFNRDGMVDVADLLTMVGNFGA
jgi:hypothetical protein